MCTLGRRQWESWVGSWLSQTAGCPQASPIHLSPRFLLGIKWGRPYFLQQYLAMVSDRQGTWCSGLGSSLPRDLNHFCPSRLGLGSPRTPHHAPSSVLGVDLYCEGSWSFARLCFPALLVRQTSSDLGFQCLAGCRTMGLACVQGRVVSSDPRAQLSPLGEAGGALASRSWSRPGLELAVGSPRGGAPRQALGEGRGQRDRWGFSCPLRGG